MTTRETTRLLPRSDAAGDRRFGDRVSVWAYGAVQWPWLLRSLSGGRRADKLALLDRIGLPHDALPNLGSWKADTMLLTHIVDAIAEVRPRQVVELGCGATTLVAAQALHRIGAGALTSYDQHADFAVSTGEWVAGYGLDADMRHAPLGPAPAGWPGLWYQLADLPEIIDLLIIDGPPWSIHPHVRGSAETLFDRIPVGGRVLLDDAARPGERVVAGRWRKRWPGFEFRLDRRGTKGTLIGIRRA
jgi:hypothetical protein